MVMMFVGGVVLMLHGILDPTAPTDQTPPTPTVGTAQKVLVTDPNFSQPKKWLSC